MTNYKTAIVTGVTGQDGAYLSEYLLGLGYKVFGTYRRTSSVNFWRLHELGIEEHPDFSLVESDLTDFSSCLRMVEKVGPDEIYNLAAQSFVGVSFDTPLTTAQITGIGPVHLLEAIRIVNTDIRFYQASTSEMFGKVQTTPQHEDTPFYPRSPYGIAKLYAHWMTINYCESYNIFGSSGILFNHESELRGLEFVTRKITDGFAKIKQNKLNVLELGNLGALRDWGYAKDYVRGMHAMLQAAEPSTFVLATGRQASIRDFVNMTAQAAGMDLEWSGNGTSEVARDRTTGEPVVQVNPKYFRPTEVDSLLGDPEKARRDLGWSADTSLEEMCAKMYARDWDRNIAGISF